MENRRGGHGAQKKVVARGAASGGWAAFAVSPGSDAGPVVCNAFVYGPDTGCSPRSEAMPKLGGCSRPCHEGADFVDVLVLNSRWHDSFCLKPGACLSPMSWVGSQS